MEQHKSLFELRDGKFVKTGEAPVDCDVVTVLGREPEDNEFFVWGYGMTEKERREDAEQSLITYQIHK